MSTLRDRLVALAEAATWRKPDNESFDRLAFDAARMALEDARDACIAERVDAEATGAPEDKAYNVATSHCAAAIRALRDGLD